MKTLKLTVLLLATVLIMNGCSNKENLICCLNPFYQHLIWLSFQDASGNDLVKGIGFDTWNSEIGGLVTGKEGDGGGPVKREFYTLEYVYEDGIPNPWKPEPKPWVIYDVRYPEIALHEIMPSEFNANPNYNYLWFETSSYKFTGGPEALLYGHKIEDCDFAEKIIFRLTCPYLFGNDEAHDIITWWELKKGIRNPLCYRIEFDGKKITEIVYAKDSSFSLATIVLDR